MFTAPLRFDVRVGAEGTPQYWAEQVLARLRLVDPQKPQPCLLGAFGRLASAIGSL